MEGPRRGTGRGGGGPLGRDREGRQYVKSVTTSELSFKYLATNYNFLSSKSVNSRFNFTEAKPSERFTILRNEAVKGQFGGSYSCVYVAEVELNTKRATLTSVSWKQRSSVMNETMMDVRKPLLMVTSHLAHLLLS